MSLLQRPSPRSKGAAAHRAGVSKTRAPSAPVNRDLRAQLLRLDRIDSQLRDAWVRTEFKDRTLERKLDTLTTSGIDWLRGVIAEHGWPGHALVGAAAAAAAWRLVQHAECAISFQRRCLTLLRDAAKRGDVPLEQVAYLTDVVRMREGKKQLYGTKFRKVKGQLVPHPIERPDTVDARRKQLNLPPLEVYARRIRRHFLPA